ncbi:MAG: 2,3-dimethylmalate lyase [Chloroflexota bacterium]|jgi:2-methylisocitrate lyase-like PEP mutase family enzyme|nr:2,3-dimethylmalate lyase [Chloroflexota bacterium]
MSDPRRERLRELLAAPGLVIAPGAYDALSARLIEQAGFGVVYMTGSGAANSMLGEPDLGLTTMTEMAGQATRICNATSLPVVADADTGYGGPLNVKRTVEEYERAGVAGLHIEDQTFPKRCGHFAGKTVVPVEEMVGRIRAACAARRDPGLVIIARSDAAAVEGLEAALVRGRAYVAAGADALFIEAPHSVDELRAIGAAFDVPLIANMVEGGRTPVVPAAELETMGFKLVLHAGALLRSAVLAVQATLQYIRANRSTLGIEDNLITFDERNRVTDLAGRLSWADQFTSEPART